MTTYLDLDLIISQKVAPGFQVFDHEFTMVLMSILIVVGLIVIVSLLLDGATARCKDQYRNKKYTKRRCKITEIPKDIPKEATKLDLYSNHIQKIPSGAFDGLSSLEDLDLRFNQISDIDPGAFLSLCSNALVYGCHTIS